MQTGNVLVDMENWGEYFGPYASRSYLVASEALKKSGERKMGKMGDSGDKED